MRDRLTRQNPDGWQNAAGNDVANQDLLQEASNLDDDLKAEGNVQYIWIPRAENEDADRHCNIAMDNVRSEEDDTDSDYY